jgi:hypothetical protein
MAQQSNPLDLGDINLVPDHDIQQSYHSKPTQMNITANQSYWEWNNNGNTPLLNGDIQGFEVDGDTLKSEEHQKSSNMQGYEVSRSKIVNKNLKFVILESGIPFLFYIYKLATRGKLYGQNITKAV